MYFFYLIEQNSKFLFRALHIPELNVRIRTAIETITAEMLQTNCEVREKINKMQQMFIFNNFSTCFGHHYAHLQENKTYVTVCGVLHWFCWMWLVVEKLLKMNI